MSASLAVWVMLRRFAWVALAWGLLGCSADGANEPEPLLTTPGAFFVVPERDGGYTLLRTLDEFHLSPTESLLWVRTYAVAPATLVEARRLAQEEHLPVRERAAMIAWADVEQGQVVWFRTLTEEEASELR